MSAEKLAQIMALLGHVRTVLQTVLLAIALPACSSSTTTQAADCTDSDCLEEVAGSTSVGGSSATGGTTSGVGGSTEETAGTSNVGTATGGSSSTGGTTCIPKTCDMIAPAWDSKSGLSKPVVCGYPSDGCGDILTCGACVSDGTVDTGCGEATVNANGWDWSGMGLVPTANLCGTRCVKREACDVSGTGWLCPSTLPPLGIAGCKVVSKAGSIQAWCCTVEKI
jgi:hypothetical protein